MYSGYTLDRFPSEEYDKSHIQVASRDRYLLRLPASIPKVSLSLLLACRACAAIPWGFAHGCTERAPHAKKKGPLLYILCPLSSLSAPVTSSPPSPIKNTERNAFLPCLQMNSSHRKRKQTASAVDDDDGLGVEEPVSKQARVGEQPEALSTPAPRAAPAPAPAPAPVPATAPAPAPKPSKPWQRDPQKPDAVKLLIAQKAAAAAGLSLAPLGAPVQQAPAPRIPRDGAGSVVRAPVSGPPFAGILAQSLCLAYKFQPTLHSATVRKYPGIPLADNNQPVVIIPTGSSLSNKLCGLIPGVKKSKKDVEKRPNPDKALATTSYSVRFEGDIRYKPPNADGEVDQAIFLVVGSLGANYTAGKEINMGANIEVHAQFYAQESISVVQCVCILFCFDENGERVEFGYKTVKGEFIQGYHIMEVWSLSKTRDEVYTTPLWQGM